MCAFRCLSIERIIGAPQSGPPRPPAAAVLVRADKSRTVFIVLHVVRAANVLYSHEPLCLLWYISSRRGLHKRISIASQLAQVQRCLTRSAQLAQCDGALLSWGLQQSSYDTLQASLLAIDMLVITTSACTISPLLRWADLDQFGSNGRRHRPSPATPASTHTRCRAHALH